MNTITTKDGVQIFYKDGGGRGQPRLLSFTMAGRCSADDWDTQMVFFSARVPVIAHDRRGHGRSSQVSGAMRWITTQPTPRRWSNILTSQCRSRRPFHRRRRSGARRREL